MAATRLIAMHVQKNRSLQQCIKDRTDYAENGEKTADGEYVSSYECDPETVDREFAITKNEYARITGRPQHKNDIIAYQIRQSFKPGEITPEEANEIGYETAMRWTKGKHAFIVATHIDKDHIHNHIIYNSTNLEADHKFHNFFFSGIALQKVSDLICLEHGMSIIKPRKPSEREKRTVHPDAKTFRATIREAMDECFKQKPKDLEEFLKLLESMDYEIKRGKYISIKGPEQKKFIRLRSLGAGYRDDDIVKILSGEKKAPERKTHNDKNTSEERLDLLVDIQKMIEKGKGPGYERWAKVHNIKQVAQTLMFLQEHDIRDYDKLAERASESSTSFGELSVKIKECEKRLGEIAVLKTHIINYSKTKDVYVNYRKAGYSKKFFEAHREEITLHKAAKDAFSKLEGPIPKVKALNDEYANVLQEKKEAYSKYRAAKENMKDYQTAKYNIDHFLKLQDEEQNRQKKKDREQSL